MRLLLALAALLAATAAHAQNTRSTNNITITIATGNTFQAILSAGPRFSLEIENNNTMDTCWIKFGTGVTAANATKATSITLAPGGSYTRYSPNSYVPQDEIEATCATTGDTLYLAVQ